jgi:hypothetical protein
MVSTLDVNVEGWAHHADAEMFGRYSKMKA